eukprot:226581-Chlamydomonas_euryale.AAC.1
MCVCGEGGGEGVNGGQVRRVPRDAGWKVVLKLVCFLLWLCRLGHGHSFGSSESYGAGADMCAQIKALSTASMKIGEALSGSRGSSSSGVEQQSANADSSPGDDKKEKK